MDKLLEIKNLTIQYVTDDGTVHAVNDLSFSLDRGQSLGLVGETGAGKTTTAKAILGVLPKPQAHILSGEILCDGIDLLKTPEKDMRQIRGNKVAMIFQDPMTSLNPVLTVGDQVQEVIMLHQTKSRVEAAEKTKEMFELVGIKAERVNEYPHQFSGGMKQRVGIAMALACNPELLIADEPTTALDVTIQAQVLDLMKKLREQYNTAMIMITHDLGIVAEICDHVAVMYAGSVVEYGSKEDIFLHPSHPYTIGLFGCIPDLSMDQSELKPIKGLMPDPTNLPSGCPFAPRCPDATEECSKEHPENYNLSDTHTVRCFKFKKEEVK